MHSFCSVRLCIKVQVILISISTYSPAPFSLDLRRMLINLFTYMLPHTPITGCCWIPIHTFTNRTVVIFFTKRIYVKHPIKRTKEIKHYLPWKSMWPSKPMWPLKSMVWYLCQKWEILTTYMKFSHLIWNFFLIVYEIFSSHMKFSQHIWNFLIVYEIFSSDMKFS